MQTIKDFLYLDTDLVNSIFSQYFEGVITGMSKTSSDTDGIKAKIGFDLKLVKGSAGGSSDSTSGKSETIDLHHYAYSMIEDQLVTDSVIDGDKNDIVMLSGNLRIVDSEKAVEVLGGLKGLVAGLDAAAKLAPDSQSANAIPQEMRGAIKNSKDLGQLITQLSGGKVFAYIADERIALNRNYVVGETSPEFSNNGRLFDGEYVVVGLKTIVSANDDDIDKSDILLTMSKAFSGVQDLMNISNIKPIAIYRVVSKQ